MVRREGKNEMRMIDWEEGRGRVLGGIDKRKRGLGGREEEQRIGRKGR